MTDDGWVKWDGSTLGPSRTVGEGSPVPLDTMVEVRFVDRTVGKPWPAGALRWNKIQSSGDIIAYRVPSPYLPQSDDWMMDALVELKP